MSEGFLFGIVAGMWLSTGLRYLGEYMRDRRNKGADL